MKLTWKIERDSFVGGKVPVPVLPPPRHHCCWEVASKPTHVSNKTSKPTHVSNKTSKPTHVSNKTGCIISILCYVC